ncbi:hypothetical protein NHX12_020592 [Muraenolepis orangiensis]|uniref:Uncharacterized protein n=1 Tax=Muraenolepis orangiensis TaxID=630683 RepID=A0A9Q0EV63_9TELE|nr:hypothetical protein NHX12_020592 [Muraenolepis orangiensis]
MPVVGVASKLRPPSSTGPKPIHTALPMPHASRMHGPAPSGHAPSPRHAPGGMATGDPQLGVACQLSIKSETGVGGRSQDETDQRTKICKVLDRAVSCLSGPGCVLSVCIGLCPVCLDRAVFCLSGPGCVLSVWTGLCPVCLDRAVFCLSGPGCVLSVWTGLCPVCLDRAVSCLSGPGCDLSVWTGLCPVCLDRAVTCLSGPGCVLSVWTGLCPVCRR